MTGSLFIVASPIGNLEDITYRAVRVLRESDWIACEDTRHSRRLLEHYGIRTPTISYHEHNEAARAEELLTLLKGGKTIALLSDAGTPLISDPGYRLVHRAIEAGVAVHPIPGPSALLAALAVAGFPTDEFVFGGFLPSKRGQRRRFLEEEAVAEARPMVFFEAPHRILETLADLAALLGDRPIVVGREITKLHEEFLRGRAGEVLATLAARGPAKGEFTLVIAAAGQERVADAGAAVARAREAMAAGTPRTQAIKDAARRHGMARRELYRLLEERGAESP